MNLLDLPPEIFGKIIHELVSDVGILEAWKHGEVCNTFAQAIRYEVFAKQRIRAFDPNPPRRFVLSFQYTKKIERFSIDNFGRILFHRCKLLLDADSFIPAKLNEIVDHLITLGGNDDSETLRNSLLRRLCAAVAQPSEGHSVGDVLHRLRNGSSTGISDRDCTAIDWEVFNALIAMGDVDQAFNMTPRTEGMKLQSFLFGVPLLKLVERGDAHHIQTLLNIYAQNPEALNPDADWGMHDVILSAVKHANPATLEPLLQFHKDVIGEISKKDLSKWMRECIHNKVPENLGVVMSFKSPSQTLNFSLFEEACTTGNPKVVSELLAKPNSRINGRIKPDQEVGAWTPLVVAIESGYVGVVRAVLKAGASVEGIESTRGQTMISPLQAALVHANAAMVQLLIKKGAKVRPRPWHTWRRGQRRFGCSAYDYNVGKGGVVDPVVFALASQERELYEILRQAKKDQENIRLPAYWSV